MKTLKDKVILILTTVIAFLGAVLFSRNRKIKRVESELNGALADKEISVNEEARKAARDHANRLVDEYERSKRK